MVLAGLSLSIYCWRSGTAGVASRSAYSPTLTRRSVMAEKRMLVLCLVAFAATVLGLLFGAALHVALR